MPKTKPLTKTKKNGRVKPSASRKHKGVSKKLPCTPPKTPVPLPLPDPTQPMTNAREERFCVLRSRNITQWSAYRTAINPRRPKKSALSRGSELNRRPDIAARVTFLQGPQTTGRNQSGIIPPAHPIEAAAPQTPPAAPPAAPMKTGKLTRQEIDDTLSSAVRSAASSTEKTQALKLARDMLGLESEKANADPEAILKYITSTAGKTHQEIAQDMGGIRRALETVLAFLKVPHSTGLRVLGRMYRDGMATSKATQGEDTQAGKDLLPDGESDNINDGDDIDTPREAAEGDGEGGLA